jgi:hypothetical protein
MLMVMNKARQKRTAAEGATAAETPDGGEEVFGNRQRVTAGGDTGLIDRNFFTDARRQESARLASIRERGRLERIGDPFTPEQIDNLVTVSAQVGLPLDRETLRTVRGAERDRLMESYESAARDYGLPPIRTSTYDAVASQVVSPNGVQNAAQADAFLLGLEEKARQRQAAAELADAEAQMAAARAGEPTWIDPDIMIDTDPTDLANMRSELDHVTDCGPYLSDAQVVDLNQKMHAAGIHPVPVAGAAEAGKPDYGKLYENWEAAGKPAQLGWQQDPKDPRNWDTAQDPISPKQQFRLEEAGLNPDEIARLGKGEASVVVGEYFGPDKNLPPNPERARKAYDRVQSDAIAAASGLDGAKPVRVVDVPSATTTPTTTATPEPTPKPIIRPTQ